MEPVLASLVIGGSFATNAMLAYHHTVEKENPAKYNWMIQAGLVVAAPVVGKAIKSVASEKDKQLATAIGKTARAGAAAIYIASLDGPLPFADVAAATYFGVSAAMSWHDYLS